MNKHQVLGTVQSVTANIANQNAFLQPFNLQFLSTKMFLFDSCFPIPKALFLLRTNFFVVTLSRNRENYVFMYVLFIFIFLW